MIGIIGAYGEIGKKVTNFLKENYNEKLLLGGRNSKQAFINEQALDNCKLMNINMDNPISVESFVKKCDVVVNCSGKKKKKKKKKKKTRRWNCLKKKKKKQKKNHMKKQQEILKQKKKKKII
eukprot:TRINITY_DN8396_c0_g1_i2.p5 TRINITY_DN8396_c0_g1~~TRINITY_DN8396_c0_g1_i2.p5  ORF type:complete len:122 (+),score=49.83 TRINITY_DN8396_c0_g1_i2:586-951(+)